MPMFGRRPPLVISLLCCSAGGCGGITYHQPGHSQVFNHTRMAPVILNVGQELLLTTGTGSYEFPWRVRMEAEKSHLVEFREQLDPGQAQLFIKGVQPGVTTVFVMPGRHELTHEALKGDLLESQENMRKYLPLYSPTDAYRQWANRHSWKILDIDAEELDPDALRIIALESLCQSWFEVVVRDGSQSIWTVPSAHTQSATGESH